MNWKVLLSWLLNEQISPPVQGCNSGNITIAQRGVCLLDIVILLEHQHAIYCEKT